jgi:hypothetical protein
MGSAGDLRTVIKQLLEHGHSLIWLSALNQDASIEKLCFGANMLAGEDRFDTRQSCCVVSFGNMFAGLGQDAGMPQAFSLCELKSISIPHGENDAHDNDHNRNREDCNGRNSISV